jgi:DNA-binding response OmpR family regulator
MKIMLVEDDFALNKAIINYFAEDNFDIESFADGKDALEVIDGNYDLFLIDINVPNVSGLDLLRAIRAKRRLAPILILSGETSIHTIEEAYEHGCTDFIKKPFNIREIELKIKRLMRTDNDIVKIGRTFTFDPVKQKLWENGQEIHLPIQERKLLDLLARNKNEIVDKDYLILTIWGKVVDSVNLRQVVKRLRDKLPEGTLNNVSGNGYILHI